MQRHDFSLSDMAVIAASGCCFLAVRLTLILYLQRMTSSWPSPGNIPLIDIYFYSSFMLSIPTGCMLILFPLRQRREFAGLFKHKAIEVFSAVFAPPFNKGHGECRSDLIHHSLTRQRPGGQNRFSPADGPTGDPSAEGLSPSRGRGSESQK